MKKLLFWLPIFFIVSAAGYYFFPEPPLPVNTKIDKLVVLKSESKMLAYAQGKVVKTYTVSIGKNSIGHKQVKGDKRTPEGVYSINAKNPHSGYHKNLGVSYPNKTDRAEAQRANNDPGGDIKIHGLKNGRGWIGKFHRLRNWTLGCIAVTDEEVDELYEHVAIGTVIEIRP